MLCPAIGTDAPKLAEIEAWGLPVVTVMRRLRAGWISSVAPDNIGGARRATEHLIELGHRRIAFLGGRSGMVVQEDRRDRLGAGAGGGAGLPADPALIVETHAQPRRRHDARWPQVLAVPDPPTAALCFNDVVAIGVLYGLAERGLAAGRDFAVVGFDDIVDARLIQPALTTVAVESRNARRARGRHPARYAARGPPRPAALHRRGPADRPRVVRGASCATIRGAA